MLAATPATSSLGNALAGNGDERTDQRTNRAGQDLTCRDHPLTKFETRKYC